MKISLIEYVKSYFIENNLGKIIFILYDYEYECLCVMTSKIKFFHLSLDDFRFELKIDKYYIDNIHILKLFLEHLVKFLLMN